MSTPLFNSRFYNLSKLEIDGVIAYEVERSETHGSVETLEQKVKTLTEIVGLMATFLTDDQKIAMGQALGYTKMENPW